MRSARVKGPMGCAIPNFMMASMASGVPTPSSKQKIASFIMGMRIRLDTNPGESLHSTGILPICVDKSVIRLVIESSVSFPLTISTNFIIGTGFIKCIPITFSGRCVAVAILLMEIEDVLLAKMVSGLQTLSNSLNIFNLIFLFSVAASITKSHAEN